jgi:HD domain
MITESLIEADSLRDLQIALGTVASHHWQARVCHFLVYDENKHVIRHGDAEWDLSSEHQPGACAMTLRPVNDQALPWPEAIAGKSAYRTCRPIFHWGSLKAVLCLGFDREPGELEGLGEVEKSLGILGERVIRREMGDAFMGRCKELFVQAVEARGKNGHVQRCCRLVSSLASMLDCSAQVQADLLEAAQYHDIGLLTFEKAESVEAMREHARVGASLLRCHPELYEIAQLVEGHHERYDGSGVPYGKQGDELALECWILALVEDFVEFWEGSMATYQMKMEEFFSGSAKHHHPDVVDALCGLVDAEKLPDLMG